MKDVDRSIRSPNFDSVEIPVAFVVLHYTAGRLPAAIRAFSDRMAEVSTHLLIDTDGRTYELVECLSGTAFRARHAGLSRWLEEGQLLESFNDFSIGIELVNPNGNLVPYSTAQHQALYEMLSQLKSIYPALESPTRVVGHEHISGWRGKADPGRLFDWASLFAEVYPGLTAPVRRPRCPASLADALEALLSFMPEDEDEFWHAVSVLTEEALALITEGSEPE